MAVGARRQPCRVPSRRSVSRGSTLVPQGPDTKVGRKCARARGVRGGPSSGGLRIVVTARVDAELCEDPGAQQNPEFRLAETEPSVRVPATTQRHHLLQPGSWVSAWRQRNLGGRASRCGRSRSCGWPGRWDTRHSLDGLLRPRRPRLRRPAGGRTRSDLAAGRLRCSVGVRARSSKGSDGLAERAHRRQAQPASRGATRAAPGQPLHLPGSVPVDDWCDRAASVEPSTRRRK